MSISMIFLHNVHDFASEEARSSISLTSFDILMHSLSNILTDFLNSVLSICNCSSFSAFARITASGDFNSCEAEAIKSFWLYEIIMIKDGCIESVTELPD